MFPRQVWSSSNGPRRRPSRPSPRNCPVGEVFLCDVKIVDVKRKPAGLGNGVRIAVDQLKPEVLAELQKYGFYTRKASDGFADLYGASGEVLIETKDGVQYVLRFGEIAPEIHLGSSAAPAAGDKPEDKQIKIHRYLFVTTQVAPSVLMPPALEVEPDAFAFTHALARDAVYGQLPRTRRRRLHLTVAGAVAAVGGSSVDWAATLSHHYLLADDPAHAREVVDTTVRAADHSLDVLAYERAIEQYTSAVTTLERFALEDARTASIHLGLGAAHRRVGAPASPAPLFVTSSRAA